MDQLNITAPAVVTEVTGQVSVIDVKGNVRGVIPGDALFPGELLITAAGSNVEFKFFDVKQALDEGCITCIPSSSTETLTASKADIRALQKAIAEGMDPSVAGEAAASGKELVSSTGMVLIERTNTSILAEAGFDSAATEFATLTPFEPVVAYGADLQNDTATVDEDSSANSISVLDNDGVILGGELEIVGVSAEHGEVSVQDDGTISYMPDPNFNGNDTITYTVENEQGITSTATVAVEVTNVNDNPIGQDGSHSAIEDGETITGQLVATDIDGDELTFSLGSTSAPAGLVLYNDGSYSFDPTEPAYDGLAEGEPLNLVVPITINDGEGGEAQSRLTITVIGTNDAPQAYAHFDTTDEGDADLVGQVPTATDVDSDGINPNGYQLMAGPEEGELTFNRDGSFQFSTNGAFQDLAVDDTRDVTFSYVASDHHGATSEPATVTIRINGTNNAPVAQVHSDTAVEDGDATYGQVPAAFDVDSDGIDPNGYQLVSDVDEGGLEFNTDGSYRFTTNGQFQDLAEGEVRQVTFSYTASDEHGAVSDTALVTITVTGTNDQPKVEDINVSHDAEHAGVLTEDFVGNDIDTTDQLSYEIVSQPDGFEVINNGDGTFSFDPKDDFKYLADGQTAELTFQYRAIDDSGQPNAASEIATGTITIVGGNNAVIIGTGELENQITAEGEQFSYTIPDNAFVDPEGETISYEATLADGSPLPDWLSFDTTTGEFSGTPAAADIGLLQVTVTATDPHGAGIDADYNLLVLKAVDSEGGPLERDVNGEVYELKGSGDIYMNISVLVDDATSYKNSYGYYFVDSDGNPIQGELLLLDSIDLLNSAAGTPTDIKVNVSAEDIPDGAAAIGFFLIPNGNNAAYNADNTNNPEYKEGAQVDFKYNSALNIFEAYIGDKLVTTNGPEHGSQNSTDTLLSFSQTSLMGGENQEDSVNNGLGEYVLGDRPGVNDINDLYATYDIVQAKTVTGSEDSEWLRGTDSDEVLFSGGGNDILTGCDGEDHFVWLKGEHGSEAEPQNAIIRDFNLADDKLNLGDLLEGESLNTLDQFLSFDTKDVEVNGLTRTDTVISINHDGLGGSDLSITLNGVDLAAEYGNSQSDILNGLLDNNKLVVDL